MAPIYSTSFKVICPNTIIVKVGLTLEFLWNTLKLILMEIILNSIIFVSLVKKIEKQQTCTLLHQELFDSTKVKRRGTIWENYGMVASKQTPILIYRWKFLTNPSYIFVLMYSTCEHQPFYIKFHNVAKISKHLLQIQKNCKMSPNLCTWFK